MIIAIRPGQTVRIGLRQEVDALVGLEVILHPELRAAGVDPHICMAGKAVHMTPGFRNASIAHEPRHLVRRLGRQRPEVPLHIMVAQAVVRAALLRTDEMLELQGIAQEKDRRVITHHVIVALAGIELQRETARVAPGVRTAALTSHRREADQRLGLGARLEDRGPRVVADVLGDLEMTEGATALGVRLSLRDALAIEVRHLLDQVMIVQNDGAVRTDGE